MSEMPPSPPQEINLNYETPSPTGNAALLVRLAAIFLLIAAGLDLLYFVARGIGAIVGAAFSSRSLISVPLYYQIFSFAVAILLPLLSLGEAGLKSVAALKFLRDGSNRWTWGLAAGIGSCIEIWSCPCCFASWATGIYTIIILCLPNVRTFLATPSERIASRAFPVFPEPPENTFRPED